MEPNQRTATNPTIAWFTWGIPTAEWIMTKGWYGKGTSAHEQMMIQRRQKFIDLLASAE